MKKLLVATLPPIAVLVSVVTIVACSAYNKLPKENKLKEEVSQMLTEAQLNPQGLELTDYGRTRNGTEDVVVANAHFGYKNLKFTCAVIGYEKETVMGSCASGNISTNAQFKLDKKSGTTTYKKATAKSDNSNNGQGTKFCDLDGTGDCP